MIMPLLKLQTSSPKTEKQAELFEKISLMLAPPLRLLPFQASGRFSAANQHKAGKRHNKRQEKEKRNHSINPKSKLKLKSQ